MKYLLAVLLMGLLSACSLGASSPSEQPLESIGQSESMAPSEGASFMDESSPSAEASGMTGAACDDAWSSVDVTSIQSVSDLDTIASELDATFQDCGSLDEWLTAANDAVPSLDTTTLETWVATHCAMNSTLSDTPVCTEVGS
jgi:hypothetical protein